MGDTCGSYSTRFLIRTSEQEEQAVLRVSRLLAVLASCVPSSAFLGLAAAVDSDDGTTVDLLVGGLASLFFGLAFGGEQPRWAVGFCFRNDAMPHDNSQHGRLWSPTYCRSV
jgi:hypothetical protein